MTPTLTELQRLRYELIDALMQTEDVMRLRKIREMFKSSVVERPAAPPDIPVVDIKSGLTLEDIEAEQEITPIDVTEFRKNIEAEDWDMSLEELLETLD